MSKLKDGLDKINKNNKTTNINIFKDKNTITQMKKLVNTIDINYKLNNNNSYYDYDKNNSKLFYDSTDSSNELIIEKENIIIDREINSLGELIQLINDFPILDNTTYNINLESLHNIKKPLIELNNMIGMQNLKTNILDQLLFYVQGFHLKDGNDYMHTILYGSPGTGKTEVAKIIGKIFSELGILKNNTFKKVIRSDLIAGYLGQTAIKTTKVIQEALGGVLFIDEAYALGNPDNRDSFAKECIDTLNEALSDYKDNIMVIIAGYEKDLETCFFSYNSGLKSRFPWKFKTDDYSAEDLKNIFLKKMKDINWSFDEDLETSFFEKNMNYFPYYGRDMEILLLKTKIVHSRRVFCKDNNEKTILKLIDLEKGFELFKKYIKIIELEPHNYTMYN